MTGTVTELPPAAPEEMLTVAEVAAVLRLGFSTTRRLVMGDNPAIPSSKIGHLRRVRRADLDAYIRNLPAA